LIAPYPDSATAFLNQNPAAALLWELSGDINELTGLGVPPDDLRTASKFTVGHLGASEDRGWKRSSTSAANLPGNHIITGDDDINLRTVAINRTLAGG
jgi:hypothetical protein